MQHMTRMLVIASLALMAPLAVAEEMKNDAGMMDDEPMAQSMANDGMEKDDMADDMGHGMKDQTMQSDDMDHMKDDDMKGQPMDDKTMDDKDTM